MKRLEPSYLHHRHGWQLGHAPSDWYASDCPGDESLAGDPSPWIFALGFIPGLAVLSPELGWFRWGAACVSAAVFASAIVYHVRVYEPFHSRERFARARIRRRECVTCGTKLAVGSNERCSDCRETAAAVAAIGR